MVKFFNNSLAVLIVLPPQKKPRALPKLQSLPTQIQHLGFFSDKSAEFIEFDEGANLCLWVAFWYLLGGFD